MADSYEPTAGMVEEAQKGLDWRSEFGRGGTAVGIARARDIVNGRNLPFDTVQRMNSFFARHEVDKKAEGFRPGEDGFPSNGRIAWALWGGDAGQSWAARIVGSMEEKAAEPMTETREIEGLYPLAPRQNAIYDDLEEIVDIFGQFDQGIGADGAHYAGPEVNPFAAEGMVCSNCAFYEGPRACEIVAGDIDPAAVCKFWIIPESLLQIAPVVAESVMYPMDEMNPMDPAVMEEEGMKDYKFMPKPRSRSAERETLERSVSFEIRAAEDNADGLTLVGYAATFDNTTRIDNWEGTFDEKIARGAFKRSINARTPVLQFEHGRHPLLGSMPLGTITKLREDDHGLYVEARLADNWLIQPVRDAIASGAIDGMSFRFQVIKESWNDTSAVPVRTLEEVKLMELGPVVFPAYESTTVGVRSASLDELFELPSSDREAIARALVLGTSFGPASGTSEDLTTVTPDPLLHSGTTPSQRETFFRTIEGVL
jgi:HK97 family phage prohead protease